MKQWVGMTLLVLLIVTQFTGCDKSDVTEPEVAVKEVPGEIKEEHFESGQIKKRGKWVMDEQGNEVKHGLHEAWHTSGQKEGEYNFSFGQQHGWTKRWHDNGIQAFECRFEEDKPIRGTEKVWLYDGSLVDLDAMMRKMRRE